MTYLVVNKRVYIRHILLSTSCFKEWTNGIRGKIVCKCRYTYTGLFFIMKNQNQVGFSRLVISAKQLMTVGFDEFVKWTTRTPNSVG